jgi:hypothetical protein
LMPSIILRTMAKCKGSPTAKSHRAATLRSKGNRRSTA